VNYPGDLDVAVARWLEGRRGVAAATAALTRSYRAGATSSGVDLSAYLASRLPATFAANSAVHRAMAVAWPAFVPHSLLDIGTGPGTASWAACQQWPMLQSIVQCEQDSGFSELAATLNAGSALPALQSAQLYRCAEATLPDKITADLVAASYVLAEMPVPESTKAVARLWARAHVALVLIEPGTPQGFERLRQARTMLLQAGAFIVAPCTHHSLCPMVDGDWCHFKTRVQRSRAHMQAKHAIVPFEDEAFSYLVVARHAVAQQGARIVAPTQVNKVAVTLPVCDSAGLRKVAIASRDKPAYKQAKKLSWGNILA
jgi:ribosomal protein RSM22 (predicted rRNA methylase)